MPATIVATRGSLLGLVLAQVVIGMAVAGVLSIAMLGEAFPAPVRSTGVALTAGIATAVWWNRALDLPDSRQGDRRPGGTRRLRGRDRQQALVALWRWPETAFRDID